ncbi:MAG: C40 family peptidase [Methylobacteriaceae bacterium]|nr:C40 family peptidase [Methylobacteriaceae bacterium]
MIVCRVEVAPVRAEPDDAAEQVTQLLRGEPVGVATERDGWLRVATAYDYPGWVRAEAVGEGEVDLPAPFAEPLEAARSFLGAPYEWGGLTRSGIDCSGLVHMAYRLGGSWIVRDSWQQEAAGEPLPEPERPGDRVSYGGPERADHVAFWLGGGRILHATARDGLRVVEEPEPAELTQRRRKSFRLPLDRVPHSG